MWFERDLPRLNVLLELLGEWVRVGTHASLFTLLGRVKWVVDYKACFVAIDEAPDGGIFAVRGGVVVRTATEALPSSVSDVLTSIRTQRRIFAATGASMQIIGAPLLADGHFLGVMIFVARDGEPYGQQDVRFLESIADYFARAWWRIAQRELQEQQELEGRRKDEFLALLGHELRNPLAPMVTALELMRTGGDHAREREILERQVRHMTRLVDDLMDVARISRGKLEITRRHVYVGELVATAVEMAGPAVGARGHRLLVEQDETLAVSGDFGRLAQILTNVLTNAAKFSDAQSTIRLRTEGSSAQVRIFIVDEGEGIAHEDLEKVFERFVQLGDRGLDRPGGGLGLGLALARELARAHGGELSALSPGPGLGTTFLLELPRAADESLPPPSPFGQPSTAPSPHGRLRVLLVDDNIDAAEMLTCMLEAKAFEVRVAHDGPSALREAATFEPDVGILDIGLPGMDGFELAASLRRDPARARMRLVALTGYGRDADIAKGHAAGFDAHLVKPVDFAKLERSLFP